MSFDAPIKAIGEKDLVAPKSTFKSITEAVSRVTMKPLPRFSRRRPPVNSRSRWLLTAKGLVKDSPS